MPTDISRLNTLAAAIVEKGSPNIRRYAIEQARVTAEQEARLRKLEAAQGKSGTYG